MPGKSKSCLKGRHDECSFFKSCFCECDCHKGSFVDYTEKSLTALAGVGMAVGGLAITVGTLGLAAPVGGAIMGAGISSTVHSIEKAISGERIKMVSLSVDIGLGMATGAATGGIGAIGEVAATAAIKTGATQVVKAGVIKCGVRAAAGATAGLTAKAVDEIKRSANGEESGSAASWVASAAVGAIGGIGCHISSNATKAVSSGVAKSVIRVGISGTTAATGDSLIQGVNIATGNQDSYDVKQTIRSAAVSSITTAACEGVKNGIYELNGGKAQMLHDKAADKTIKEVVSSDFQEEYRDQYKKLQNTDQSSQKKLDQEYGKAKMVTDANRGVASRRLVIQTFDAEIQKQDQLIGKARQNGNLDQVRQLGEKRQELLQEKLARVKQMRSDINPDNIQKSDIRHNNAGGLKNAHPLINDKAGQIACDVNPPNTIGRGEGRGVFDYNPNARKDQRYIPAGHTPDHKYENTSKPGKSPYYSHHKNYENRLEMGKNSIALVNMNESMSDSSNKKKKKRHEE